MAFTPDGIAPPGIPLLGYSPHRDEVQNGLWGPLLPLNVSPIDSISSFRLYCLSIVVWICLFFYMSKPSESTMDDFVYSRVVWLPNVCLMSSFLILCSLVTPAILRSQLISAVRVGLLFPSCFGIVQHSDP